MSTSNGTKEVPPAVSVVVVTWNRRELLRECLRSLESQSFQDFELVLVDNGSADGSLEMVEREFSGRVRFPIRIVANPDNRGFCAANNQGIDASRGSMIALLNNDAEAGPEWLASMVDVLQRHPAAGMVACKILWWEDPTRIDKVGHLIYPDGQNRGRGTGEIDHGQYDREEEVAWPDGCAALYRRQALARCGAFDEDFFLFGEDAELGLRLRIAGWNCIYAPKAVVRHHRGGTATVGSTGRLYWIERNRVLLALKLFPWRLLIWNVPYFLMRVAAGMKAAAADRGEIAKYRGLAGKLRAAGAILHGDAAALLKAPRILAKRGAVRAMAQLSPAQVAALIRRHQIPLGELMERSI